MCLYISFSTSLSFFSSPLAPWKHPAEAPGRVFCWSQDVSVHFPLSPSPLPLSSPPMVTKPFSLKDAFLRLLRAQSDIEEHLRAAEDQDTRNIWGCVRECREWGGGTVLISIVRERACSPL